MAPFNFEVGSCRPEEEQDSVAGTEREIDEVRKLDPELADDLVRATKGDGKCREQVGPEMWEMFRIVRDEAFIHAGAEFEQGYRRILSAMDPSDPERYDRLRNDVAV